LHMDGIQARSSRGTGAPMYHLQRMHNEESPRGDPPEPMGPGSKDGYGAGDHDLPYVA